MANIYHWDGMKLKILKWWSTIWKNKSQ